MQDWDLFRYVLAVERHGGLSGAARALGVTHATVSRQLARAEDALGARLFDRMPSGLTPTSAGQAVCEKAEEAEAAFRVVDVRLQDEMRASLNVTVPPLVMRPHLASDLRAFTRTHPGISLTVLADSRVFDLHRREADLAVRISRKPAESLWGRKVVTQRAGYFATRAFIEEHGQALAGSGPVPVVSFTAWPDMVPRNLKEHLPKAEVGAVCDDMVAALELVKAGFGLTRIPLAIAHSEPQLVWLSALPIENYSPIWLLTPPDLRRTAVVRRAMSHLAVCFARHQAIYSEPSALP